MSVSSSSPHSPRQVSQICAGYGTKLSILPPLYCMTINLICKTICSKLIKKENKTKAKTLLDRKKINLVLTSLIFNIVYENVICHTFRKTLRGNYICYCLFLGEGEVNIPLQNSGYSFLEWKFKTCCFEQRHI